MKPTGISSNLKHIAIAERLRGQIGDGTFAPGDRLPSFAQLRAEHGASEDTIERVYANLESERLVVRRHRVGTFVAGPEAGSARVTQGALGVTIPQHVQNDNYYTRILNGLQGAARTAGVHIVLLNELTQPNWEKVDGIVTLGPTRNFPPPPPGMPIVSLLHDRRGAVHVYNDDESGARQLTRHLLQLGHRRIGYLHAPRADPLDWEYLSGNIVEARLRGHREELMAAGIDAPDEWRRPLLTVEERTYFWKHEVFNPRIVGHAAMGKWLRDGWPALGCTAMLAQNDLVAIGMIEALQEAGLRVPEDVSVVGFDGHEAGDYFRPRLTTVTIPLEAIAARGAELLLDMVRAPLRSKPLSRTNKKKEPVLFSCTLKLGDSSAPLE